MTAATNVKGLWHFTVYVFIIIFYILTDLRLFIQGRKQNDEFTDESEVRNE